MSRPLNSIRTSLSICSVSSSSTSSCSSRHCFATTVNTSPASSSAASSLAARRRTSTSALPSSSSDSARAFSTTSSSSLPAPSEPDNSRSYLSSRPPIPREVRRTGVDSPVKIAGVTPSIEGSVPRSRASQLEISPNHEAGVETPADSSTAPIEEETHIPATLSPQSLSLLYSFSTPPPPSALAALAGRLSSSVPGHSTFSLASDLVILEQCLIHESFWVGVSSLPSSSLPRTFTNYHDAPITTTTPVLRAHNTPLASVGNSLLGAWTAELLLSSFPNLPTRVSKAALTMFVGPKSLASVATSWGISPSRLDRRLVGKVEDKKMTRKEKAYGHLVGGVGGSRNKAHEKDGAGGMGLVRWNRQPVSPQRDAVLFEDALASVARAVVGAIHKLHGFAAAREFAYAHFLSRLVPSASSHLPSAQATSAILPLLKFTNPSLTLSSHLSKCSLERPSHRLLKESGRLSNHATFVSGVYSGLTKLGEGFGSSLKMSEFRASEDAMRRFYLGGKDNSKGNSAGSDGWC